MSIRKFFFRPIGPRFRRRQVALCATALACGAFIIVTGAATWSAILALVVNAALLGSAMLSPGRDRPEAIQAARELRLLPPEDDR